MYTHRFLRTYTEHLAEILCINKMVMLLPLYKFGQAVKRRWGSLCNVQIFLRFVLIWNRLVRKIWCLQRTKYVVKKKTINRCGKYNLYKHSVDKLYAVGQVGNVVSSFADKVSRPNWLIQS